MFGRNTRDTDPELIAARDAAARESHPYTDDRANYPAAQRYRRALAEGQTLAANQQNRSPSA